MTRTDAGGFTLPMQTAESGSVASPAASESGSDLSRTLLIEFSIRVVAQLTVVATTALLFLAGLGAAGAKTGGAPIVLAAVRVTFWGALAMAVTALIGSLFGAVV